MSAPGTGGSFFPEVRAAPDGERDDPAGQPLWAGPPWHVRPGLAAVGVVLGRSSSTAVLLEGVRGYPAGLVLHLVVELRERSREARRRVFSELELTHGRGQLDLMLPPGGLRWGVELADGRRVTTLDDGSPWDAGPGADPSSWTPDRPVLQGLSRPTSWGSTWSRDVRLWPLPPARPAAAGVRLAGPRHRADRQRGRRRPAAVVRAGVSADLARGVGLSARTAASGAAAARRRSRGCRPRTRRS